MNHETSHDTTSRACSEVPDKGDDTLLGKEEDERRPARVASPPGNPAEVLRLPPRRAHEASHMWRGSGTELPSSGNVDPMAMDKCPRCDTRGNTKEMFHCEGCEEAFHPSCVSRIRPKGTKDPRLETYVCPQCRLTQNVWGPYAK